MECMSLVVMALAPLTMFGLSKLEKTMFLTDEIAKILPDGIQPSSTFERTTPFNRTNGVGTEQPRKPTTTILDGRAENGPTIGALGKSAMDCGPSSTHCILGPVLGNHVPRSNRRNDRHDPGLVVPDMRRNQHTHTSGETVLEPVRALTKPNLTKPEASLMPLANLLKSATGTCWYCGQKAEVLIRDRSGCRRTFDVGFQEMVALAAETPRTHSFNEKALRLSLAEIARRSHGDGATVNQALQEGWKRGAAHSMADGIMTQTEETRLREFRDRLALADSGADRKASQQLERASTDRLTLDARLAALAVAIIGFTP